ncbi:MarR family winged helix-turn-helix transcriptional regulator [Arthrobacter sp. M4]|uniref:MarR family winged helix-turn-helix transcriptional regulator n=1 Tax=Arthrobacter sp. M4 TaxID=218160 RepID=UPI001CDC1E37|nr:MarR family transcriptional regulator [Arthrobacter sp. M4]MCA4134319.1 MarR family transcriptional regulator [Arthrobacter sp. M4]
MAFPTTDTLPSTPEAAANQDDLLLERQLCFALTVASRSVVGAYKPVLDELGLTHPQYLVMLALWERSPRSLKDIADALLHEPATLSPILRRLEQSGFVTRKRLPGNERALAIELTESGKNLREQALAVPGTMMERLGLNRQQVAEIHATMTRLIETTQHSRP